MSKQLDAGGLATVETARQALVTALPTLRAAGYKDVATIVDLALREFNHPAYTGQINTIGINTRAAYR